MASFKIQTFPGSNESGSGQDSTEDIDGVNSLVDGSTPTSADADAAITNLEGNINTEAAAISTSLNTKFGSSPGSNRLDVISNFIDAQTVPPDSLSDIDDINLLVDGSTPTSANEGAAITNVESNISTQAASISSGLNTLFGSSPAGNRLDQIDDFVANATIPSTDPETFTSWVVGTRPDDSVLSEGDFAVDTTHGRGYRWDNTVGALLPIDVYGETFDLVARINGDEANESELTNYEERDDSFGVNATYTYGGTSVTLGGTNPNGIARLNVDQTLVDANIDNTKNFYYRLVVAQANVVGTNHNLAFQIYDGSDNFQMRRLSSTVFNRISNSFSAISLSITDDAPFDTTDTNTHVIEMYVKRDSDEDVAYAIVDGKVYHLSALDQGSNSSTTAKAIQFFASGQSSGNSMDLVVYESTFCAW